MKAPFIVIARKSVTKQLSFCAHTGLGQHEGD